MASQTNYQYTKGDELTGFLHSFVAEGAVSKNQVLQLGTAHPQVKKHVADATVAVIGVATHDASDGEMITVACFGPIKRVISDSSGITRGQLVYASGATAGACTSQAYADGTTLHGAIGIALVTADAAGEVVPVVLGWTGIVSNT